MCQGGVQITGGHPQKLCRAAVGTEDPVDGVRQWSDITPLYLDIRRKTLTAVCRLKGVRDG